MIYRTHLDNNANKELNRKNMLQWLVVLIIGLGVTAYGVVATLFSLIDSIWCSTLMVVGMLLFTFSLICIIIIIKIGKEQKNSNIDLVYDFAKSYVLVKKVQNEEVIEQEKIIYKYIIRTRETKNYIYIYKTDKTVIPFCKKDVNIDDLALIKKYFAQSED